MRPWVLCGSGSIAGVRAAVSRGKASTICSNTSRCLAHGSPFGPALDCKRASMPSGQYRSKKGSLRIVNDNHDDHPESLPDPVLPVRRTIFLARCSQPVRRTATTWLFSLMGRSLPPGGTAPTSRLRATTTMVHWMALSGLEEESLRIFPAVGLSQGQSQYSRTERSLRLGVATAASRLSGTGALRRRLRP